MRYVLIDKITELEIGRRLKGIKNVTFSDALNKPFDADWIAFPAAFALESMAQAAGILVAASSGHRSQPVLAKVQGMKIYGRATAGDQIEVTAELSELKDHGAKVYTSARTSKISIADATIFLGLVSLDDMVGDRGPICRDALIGRLETSFPGWFGSISTTEAAL